jgi:hypothetical protein
MYIVEELCGNFSHDLGEFEEFEEAQDFLIPLITQDATTLLADNPDYAEDMAWELAASYYHIREED